MFKSKAKAADFRTTAVAESEAAIARRTEEEGRAFDDPIEAGVSYCLPTGHDAPRALRRLKRAQILAFIGGFAGLGAGALIASRADDAPEQTERWMLPLAVGCSLTGFAFLFYGALAQRPIVRRYLRNHLAGAKARGGSAPIHVSIENSATSEKLKAVPEDLGVLILHPATRCLQIEGVSHRYLIYAEDVLRLYCRTTQYTEGTIVEYRIGARTLGLTISPNSLLAAVKRQTLGGASRLFDRIRQTLSAEGVGESPKN